MRIGMMADLYKPHISGVTNYIALSKKHLEQFGQEVYVFTFGGEDYIDDEPNIIRSQGVPFLDTGLYFNLIHKRQARNLIRSMDLIHVHHPFISGSLAMSYCRPTGIPIVFTSHTRYDLYAQAYFPLLPDAIGLTAIQAYLPAFCRACDMVIAPSSGMREVLIRLGVDAPITITPNGVDLHPFMREVQPRERSEFNFTNEEILLTYVGRLGPEKNLPFLLRAFFGALQAFPNIGLILIGVGPELDNLQDQVRHMGIGSRVHFTGFIPYEQIPCYLAMADAFVTASVTEVHPLSVIEAMASGLPVLGIRSPGIGDLIEDGVTGLLVKEEDLAAFTAKLVRMITNDDERREMGHYASQEVGKYSIDHTTPMMVENYQQVIERASSRRNSVRSRLFRTLDRWSR
jgi:1,2-diacylglycerol 3-alpha-glucosyltransferase